MPASPSSKVIPPAGTVWRPDTHKLIEWGRHGVLVTRPWPNPQAWARSAGENAPWRNAAGHVYRAAWNRAESERPLGAREQAQVDAWSSVPEAVQQVVVAQPEVLVLVVRWVGMTLTCTGVLLLPKLLALQ